jgi:hypothetical protein
LPGPEADCLPLDCLDGGRSAPSRSSLTVSESSHNDSATGISIPSRSGMTSERSTGAPGADASTSCPEDSPAKTSQAPAPVEGWMACARACGLRCSESLARFGLRMSLPRTPRCFALADWASCSKGLPSWGIAAHGVCLELGTLAPRTSESVCGSLLPTPTCADNALSPAMQKWPAHRRLYEVLIPTPLALDHQRGISKSHNGLPGWWERHGTGRTPSSRLPAFWEWMMGWPIGWGGSKPLETVKFQSWLQLHGECSQGCSHDPTEL